MLVGVSFPEESESACAWKGRIIGELLCTARISGELRDSTIGVDGTDLSDPFPKTLAVSGYSVVRWALVIW